MTIEEKFFKAEDPDQKIYNALVSGAERLRLSGGVYSLDLEKTRQRALECDWSPELIEEALNYGTELGRRTQNCFVRLASDVGYWAKL